MSHFVSTAWRGKVAFDSTIKDHTIQIDANGEGSDRIGPNPKPLMLSSLAGCSGIDVVEMLNKMRVKFTAFKMDVTGELSDGIPQVYTSIHMDYFFEGEIKKPEKIIKAVRYSQERYCGVTFMYRMICPMTYSIYLNDDIILEKELSKEEDK